DDLAEDGGVAAAAEGGVEVDQVDPLRALVDPVAGGGQRVAVAGLGTGLALREPHGLAICNVDSGKKREARSLREVVHLVLGVDRGAPNSARELTLAGSCAATKPDRAA